MIAAAALVALALVSPARGDGTEPPRDPNGPPEQITVFTNNPMQGAMRCMTLVVSEAPAVCHVEPAQHGEDEGLLIVPGTPEGAQLAPILNAAVDQAPGDAR